MSSPAINLLMAGLPTAGKTTYLAALWDSLESGNSRMSLSRLPESTTYLSQIRQAWLRCVEIGHTAHGVINHTTLELETNGRPIALSIPDLSGEYFRDAWEKRSWTRTIDQLVQDADGLLLFVHAKVEKPVSLDDVAALAGALGGQPGEEGAAKTTWVPEASSTEVKLVDLLQLVNLQRPDRRVVRLAVVVSAWDLVPSNPRPSSWLRDELPLVAQYLEVNPALFSYRVFGISAQGGSLEHAAELLAHAEPSTRLIARDDDGQVDVTGPIGWLASSDA